MLSATYQWLPEKQPHHPEVMPREISVNNITLNYGPNMLQGWLNIVDMDFGNEKSTVIWGENNRESKIISPWTLLLQP